jgi:hypothetical protein
MAASVVAIEAADDESVVAGVSVGRYGKALVSKATVRWCLGYLT